MNTMENTTVLITGATSGLGRQLAERLADDGATVALHGRSSERCDAVAREIREATGSERIRPHVADLASLSRVRGLADEVVDAYRRLDVLINNAGVGGGPRGSARREVSADGYELRFAVNHLAHYLLTHRLLPLIRASAPARVVNVSSVGQEAIDFDDVMMERVYEPFRAYRRSKLAQVMFTFDLAEQLAGADVTVNALHPATLMDTKMVSEWFGSSMSTVEEGLDAVYRLVADPDVAGVSGRYFNGRQESRAGEQAYDLKSRTRLRELSDRLTDAG